MDVASGYCNLEFDLASGRRGSRTNAVEPLLRVLSSAESALAVNHGAAAILLAHGALASGGDAIVSRGKLRTELRRLVTEGVSTCRSRWSLSHQKNNNRQSTTRR